MIRLTNFGWIPVLITGVVLAGVIGFVVGSLRVADLETTRRHGTAAGARLASKAGTNDGATAGRKAGWKAGFGPARNRARQAAHAREFRAEEQRIQEAAAQAAAAAEAAAAELGFEACMDTYGPDYFPPGNYTWDGLVDYCKTSSGFTGR